MDIIKIEKEALTLDSKEKSNLLYCMKYCLHRLDDHSDTGLEKGVSRNFVDYFIRVLEGDKQ